MAEPAPPLAEPLPLTPRERFAAALPGTLSARQCADVLAAADEYAAAMVEQAARTPDRQRGRHAG